MGRSTGGSQIPGKQEAPRTQWAWFKQRRRDRTCIDLIQEIGMTPCRGMGPPTHLKAFFFLVYIFFIYISNIIPLPCFLTLGNTLSPPLSPSPCFYEGVPPLTHPLPPPSPWFPYTGASIEPSQDQRPPHIDARQGHPLLYTWMEPCVLLGWWLSSWELGAGSAWFILLFFL
jgi:hypothetical protein